LKCKRCGNCCINAFFTLSHVIIEGKVINLDDLAQWITYHRCDAQKNMGLLEIKVPLPCIHLVFDEEKGIYTCQIYDKRPEICRAYFCKRAVEEH